MTPPRPGPCLAEGYAPPPGARSRRGLATAALAVALLGAPACKGEPETVDVSGSVGQREVREIYLAHAPRDGGPQGLLEPPSPSVLQVLRQLDSIRESDLARGLFLRFGSMRGAWGRVADLREALAAIREVDKPVHCHFDGADNVGYLLAASSCDRISMTPAGHLDLVGVAAEVFYARGLLDHVGVRADIIAMGRFKSAGDVFTEDDMPPETREALGAYLDDLDAALVAAVRQRTSGTEAEARALIDGGPYDAESARRAGLVDDVAYDDEAREHARLAGEVEKVRRVRMIPREEPTSLLDVLELLTQGEEAEEPAEDHIALVYLQGTIVDGDHPRPDQAVSTPFVENLRALADDDAVKAVVLRIDSPGGSALASDRMWHAVRRVASRKPVIASLGDVAASGGYYVASAATEVFGHDSSLVGSIGVLGGKLDVSPLAERVGLRSVTLSRGANASWTSAMHGFTPSERAAVERMLRSAYDLFVGRVAEGRGMPRERVLAAAEGRIMSGRVGRELGLVERQGGLGPALARARELAQLAPDAPVVEWPRQRGLVDVLSQAMGMDASDQASAAAGWAPGLPTEAARHLVRSTPARRGLELAEILSTGSHTAVVLPFVLDL